MTADIDIPRRHWDSRRVFRVVWAVCGAVVVVGVLLLVVFPTNRYVDQRDDIRDTETKLAALRRETSALEEELATFSDPSHIERVALEQLSLVAPGEELYRLSIDPRDAIEFPTSWPLPGVRRILTGE
jgi:cell division protein FtsB